MITQIRKKTDFLISIVAPVFNEENCINAFIDSIAAELQPCEYDYEIIFINDGSTDQTEANIRKILPVNKKIKLINFSRNFGKDIALTAGLDFADGDVVIPMDADLQHPPEIIKQMVKKWLEGYDIVNAQRSNRDQETFLKKSFSKLFYKVFNSLSRTPIPSKTGDFRLIDREVILNLRKLKETHRFMKGLFSWVGYNQFTLSFDRPERKSGQTKWGYKHLFNFAVDGIASFSTSILRLSIIIGFSVSLIGFSYALIILYQAIFYGNDVPGFPSLIILILVLGGIQLISMGIQGEYIGKIYEQVKNRPLYIIKDKSF